MFDNWLTMIAVAGSVYAVIALGATLRGVGWLTPGADASLLKVVVRVLMPCFIAHVILGNEALREPGNVWLPPLVGFVGVASGFAVAGTVAALLGRWIGLESPEKRRTFTLIAGLQNYGYVTIPLTIAIFDRATLGVLMVHNTGVDLAMWLLGVLVLSGRIGKGSWRLALNPPVVAMLVALPINAAGYAQAVPDLVQRALGLLAQAAIPVALLLIGATVMDELRRGGFGLLRHGWPVMAAGAVTRLALAPLVLLGLAALLVYVPAASAELRRVLFIQAAMPSAVFPIILARHYGGDPATAVRVVVATSVLGLITIPLWLALLT